MRGKTVRKVKSRLKKEYINGLRRLNLSIYSEPVTTKKPGPASAKGFIDMCGAKKASKYRE